MLGTTPERISDLPDRDRVSSDVRVLTDPAARQVATSRPVSARLPPEPRLDIDGDDAVDFWSRRDKSRSRWSAWQKRYAASVVIADGALFVACSLAAVLVRPVDARPFSAGGVRLPVTLVAAVLVPAWVGALAMSGAYRRLILSAGAEEYRRVVNASVRFTAALAIASVATKASPARFMFLFAIPASTACGIGLRLILGRNLAASRRRGSNVRRLVLVGGAKSCAELARHLHREAGAGLHVVATYHGSQSFASPSTRNLAPPIRGGRVQLLDFLRHERVDAVAIADPMPLGTGGVRRLSWELEGTGIDVLLTPGVGDAMGPRLRVYPLGGLPLVHVEEPRFAGVARTLRDALEPVLAGLLLVILSPFLLLIALAIKLDSRGPVLFRQTRVGRHGRQFTVVKFRSMVTDAEAVLHEVIDLNEHDGPLFKLRKDPRVTPVGRRLRRSSLDELPQLWNVLRGQMSFVGPRPPLPSEVENYEPAMRRRLLVKPGLTGLWQVSGRADLSWEETVRLDLHYVDNWCPSLDLTIIAKTLSAVLHGRGAY